MLGAQGPEGCSPCLKKLTIPGDSGQEGSINKPMKEHLSQKAGNLKGAPGKMVAELSPGRGAGRRPPREEPTDRRATQGVAGGTGHSVPLETTGNLDKICGTIDGSQSKTIISERRELNKVSPPYNCPVFCLEAISGLGHRERSPNRKWETH